MRFSTDISNTFVVLLKTYKYIESLSVSNPTVFLTFVFSGIKLDSSNSTMAAVTCLMAFCYHLYY